MKKIIIPLALLSILTGTAITTDAAVESCTKTIESHGATCSSLTEFFNTDCQLTWRGITLYGTVDAGVTWQNHSVPFNSRSHTGKEYVISKNSNRALWDFGPNGLNQSNIGIKGNEVLTRDWSFIFDLEAGFDPYSFRLANGVGAVKHNAGVPPAHQDTNADSSRAGQFYNSQGYVGVSSPTYGTLTVLRQNALTLDAVLAYDPMGGSYAFSPIGYSGLTCGAGDTESCRFTTSVKYKVNIDNFRVAALYQFGGYHQNNGSRGAYQIQVGVDIPKVAHGAVSLDAIYTRVKDAVFLSIGGAPNYFLTGTISNDNSVMLLAKYTYKNLSLYGGYEWIQFAPPSDIFSSFRNINGDLVTHVSNTDFNSHHRFVQVFWTGAKLILCEKVDLIGAYYHLNQSTYGATPCSNTSASTCHGTFDAISFAIDRHWTPKFDTYAGIMYSQVHDGLASGFFHHSMIDPTAGLRFRF